MGAHDNIHIPKDSWPNWIWYGIEVALVFAIAMVIGWQVSDYILEDVANVVGHGDALESWDGVSVQSDTFKKIPDDVEGKIVAMSNWIFYGIFGAVFGVWFLGIRRFVLKKRVLS